MVYLLIIFSASKNENEDDSNWLAPEKKTNQSTWSIIKEEPLIESSPPIIEQENQLDYDKFYKIGNFKIFLNYEDFIRELEENYYAFYLKNNQLISFLEAHMRSYTHTFYNGLKYYYDDSELIEWRRKHYEIDFKWGFELLYKRLIKENIFINYNVNIEDLKSYAKENLLY